MDLRETGCESVDGIYLTRDGTLWQVVMNMVMNLLGPLKKGRELLDQMGDCQRLKKGSAPWRYLLRICKYCQISDFCLCDSFLVRNLMPNTELN